RGVGSPYQRRFCPSHVPWWSLLRPDGAAPSSSGYRGRPGTRPRPRFNVMSLLQGRPPVASSSGALLASLSDRDNFVLQSGVVHVWQIALSQSADTTHRLALFLSMDERTRGERFRFVRDARRFIVSRAATRWILAKYLHVAPTSLAFTYAERGKP